MPKATDTTTPTQIYLFYPNLIGYARVILSLVSFCVLGSSPAVFLALYTISFVLDETDGRVARRFNQCTHFGSILDMLTDRASTAGLLVVLNHVMQPMPGWFTTLCSFLVFLDVASHFCRMYVSLYFKRTTHKDISESVFSFLRLYYSNRIVMGILCVGQEFSYLALYAYRMYAHVPWVRQVLTPLLLVACVLNALKQVVNVQQLLDGMHQLAVMDAKGRSVCKEKQVE